MNVESNVSFISAFFIIPEIIPINNIVGKIMLISPEYNDVGTIITMVNSREFPLNMFLISMINTPYNKRNSVR